MSAAKLLLIDGTNAMMRRATAAPDERPEEVAADAYQRALGAIRDVFATHVIACFDDVESWRYEHWPEYKGGPDGEPVAQRYTRAGMALWIAMGMECVQVRMQEADDLIGAYAKRAALAGRIACTLSTDNDLLQLTEFGVTCYTYAPKGAKFWLEARDGHYVQERFGVMPEQYVDYLTLVGGKNNLPGVPRVGAKTAVKLLTEYGRLEAIFAAGALPEQYRDQAETVKRLHTLKYDAPVPNVAAGGCFVGELKPLPRVADVRRALATKSADESPFG